MLQQLEALDVTADGRYATDAELQFLQGYVQTAALRIRAYQKLQAAERAIIKQLHAKMVATDPNLLKQGNTDLTAKWQRDTIRVLRYATLALLTDDADLFNERLLLWFGSIMGAFQAERSCQATYSLMQEVVQEHLTPQEATLFLPIWRLCREVVGKAA